MTLQDFVTCAFGYADTSRVAFDVDLPRTFRRVGGRRLGKAAKALRRTPRGEAQLAAFGTLGILTNQLPDAAERLGVSLRNTPAAVVVNVVRLKFPHTEPQIREICDTVVGAYRYLISAVTQNETCSPRPAFDFIDSTWDLPSVTDIAGEDAAYLSLRLMVPLVAEYVALRQIGVAAGDIVSHRPLPAGWRA